MPSGERQSGSTRTSSPRRSSASLAIDGSSAMPRPRTAAWVSTMKSLLASTGCTATSTDSPRWLVSGQRTSFCGSLKLSVRCEASSCGVSGVPWRCR
ncbi:Uncharacterised protein [Bordetella pertussis]|nr:Uncharacterised protein [Bordetella pertussis]